MKKNTNVEEIQNTSYNIQQNQMTMTPMTLSMITVPTSQTYQSYLIVKAVGPTPPNVLMAGSE